MDWKAIDQGYPEAMIHLGLLFTMDKGGECQPKRGAGMISEGVQGGRTFDAGQLDHYGRPLW